MNKKFIGTGLIASHIMAISLTYAFVKNSGVDNAANKRIELTPPHQKQQQQRPYNHIKRYATPLRQKRS